MPAFRALLWKEAREQGLVVLTIACILGAVLWWAAPSGGIANDPDPGRQPEGFGMTLALVGAAFGYWQMRRESRGDMWSLALHRPASPAVIFMAKVVLGVGGLLLSAGIPFAISTWWLSVPGQRPVPFDRSFIWPGVASWFGGLTWYAAGLHAGGREKRLLLGTALALFGSMAMIYAEHLETAILVSLGFSAVLLVAAYADFISGSDYEAQPLWGRIANVGVGIPAVGVNIAIVTALAGSIIAMGSPRPDETPLPAWPLAKVMSEAVIAHAQSDSGYRATEDGVLSSAQLPVDKRVADSISRDSYRDSRRWTTRLFHASPGDVWYYERRAGLISVYDSNTFALRGWLGPDGYSAGPTMPTKRFGGSLQTRWVEARDHERRSELLVLSKGVYKLNDLSRPRLLFSAPDGETILMASESQMLGDTAIGAVPWGRFNVVTTATHTYIVNPAGVVELKVPHPAGMDSNGTVTVYRALRGAGSPTFVWYRPRNVSPTDSLNHVFEFRSGSSTPLAEYRFAAVSEPIAGNRDPAISRSVSIQWAFPLIPVVQVYAMTRGVRPSAVGRRWPLASVMTCAVLACVGFWLCRRSGFSTGRTATWTAMTALTGPIALILMWAFFEWPRRGRSADPQLAGG